MIVLFTLILSFCVFRQLCFFVLTFENQSLDEWSDLIRPDSELFESINQNMQVLNLNNGIVFEPFTLNSTLNYQEITFEDFIKDNLDREGCFCNNESPLHWGLLSTYCKCFGDSVVNIPTNLSKNMTKL